MADELERALLLRDLELMGQPRNPNAVQPGRAGLLDVGVGLPERLSLLNQIFNPVEAIGQSMNAGERMMSPNMGVMDRLAALGDMASGIAGVVAPVAAASRAGTPAATALMEGLLGGSPTQEAFGDTMRAVGRDVVDRLNQPGQMPTTYANPIPGMRLSRENAPLIGHHNLSPKGVQVASEIGGIPMPSMAISRADYPLTNFGEISLLADPSMVAPSRTVSAWPTDVYTGRQPRGDVQFADQKQATSALKNDPIFGHMRDATYWMDATNSFTDADEMMKTAQLGVQEGINPKAFDNMFDYVRDVRSKLGYELYDKRDAMPGLASYANTERVLYPSELFTPSGARRKPAPYTLESVMKRMSEERAFAPGAEAGMDASPGAFRAVLTKPFKSLAEMQAARGQIWPEGSMGEVKEAFSDAYGSLLDEVSAINPNASWRSAPSALLDVALGRSPTWYGDIPSSVRANAEILGRTARDMPSEYFEAKPRRAYSLGDFRAALVPEGDSTTADALKSAGIKDVLTYGSNEERIALFKRFPELLFSAGAGVPLGLLAMSPEEEQY